MIAIDRRYISSARQSSTRCREEYEIYCRERFRELSDMSTPARADSSRRAGGGDDCGGEGPNNNNNSSAKRVRLSSVDSGTHLNTSYATTVARKLQPVVVTKQRAVEVQQSLRKGIQGLWDETKLYNETRDTQEAVMRNYSYFTAQKKPAIIQTSFKVANRWKLMVEELLRLPEELIEEEILSQLFKVLSAHHCFFRSDLGQCNEMWRDFFDVQMVSRIDRV